MGYKCWICGSEVIWNNDFNADECGHIEPGIVHYYHCPNCDAEYEVFEPISTEQEISSERA